MYRSTVIGKLLYAVNAWLGFTSAADRQRMEALVKRGVRSGLCAAGTPNSTELSESSDDALFNRVSCNQDHILFPLLPDERDFTYNLRKINHNRLLTIQQGRLCSCRLILSLECCSKPVIDFVVLHFILARLFVTYLHVILCDCRVLSTCIKRTCYAITTIEI